MPLTRTTRIPLSATRSYDAPPGLRRVRMTANPLGVQMLAAVNGEGAYDRNGRTKKARRKARKAGRKRSYWQARTRRRGLSRGQRKYARHKAKKAGKKYRKRRDKYEYESTMKRLAKRAGMKKSEFEKAWAEGWKAQYGGGKTKEEKKEEKRAEKEAEQQAHAEGGYYKGGEYHKWEDAPSSSYAANPGRARNAQMRGLNRYFKRIAKHAGHKKAAAEMRKRFGSRLAREAIEGVPMAGKKKRRRSGRKARRRSSSKRRTRRSPKRSARRTRRRSHRTRSRGRRSHRSSGRSRGRRRMRRNGEGAAGGASDYDKLLKSYGLQQTGGAASTGLKANKRGKWRKRGKWASGSKSRKWRKRGKGGGGGKYGSMLKRIAKKYGIDKSLLPDYDEYSNPLAGAIVEAVSKGIADPDKKDKAIRAVADELYGKQFRKVRAKVPVEIPDPITGEARTYWVPVRHKAQVRFGPYSRRMYKGRLSYEYKKGKHIPKWALAGAPSKEYFDSHRDFYDNVFQARYAGERSRAASKAQEKIAKKVAKLLDEGGRYVANKRGSRKRRRGKSRGRSRGGWRKRRSGKSQRRSRKSRKSRMSARGRRRLSKFARGRRRNKRGQFRRNGKRRSYRGKRRHSRGKRRHSRGKRRFGRGRRRWGKRRHSRGRSRGRRSHRRGRRGHRRGRRRMRRNAFGAALQHAFKSGGPVILGFLVHRLATFGAEKFGLAGMLPASIQPYANIITSGVMAALGIAVLDSTCPGGNPEACDKAAMGMAVSFASTAIFELLAAFGVVPSGMGEYELRGLGAGIGWENTSGWGKVFPSVGEYELRGLGAYTQAAAGLGAYTQAAAGLGGGVMQAAAGLGGGVMQAAAGYGAYELRGLGDGMPTFDGIRPEQADAALTNSERWAAAGEYRNSQMQPNPALFSEDRLQALGVPREYTGGVSTESIWLPEDPTVRVGTIQGGTSIDM